jgi:hypothetical protein
MVVSPFGLIWFLFGVISNPCIVEFARVWCYFKFSSGSYMGPYMGA